MVVLLIDDRRGVERGQLTGFWTRGTFTPVVALRHNRMVAPLPIDGAMNGETFRAYIEQFVVPKDSGLTVRVAHLFQDNSNFLFTSDTATRYKASNETWLTLDLILRIPHDGDPYRIFSMINYGSFRNLLPIIRNDNPPFRHASSNLFLRSWALFGLGWMPIGYIATTNLILA